MLLEGRNFFKSIYKSKHHSRLEKYYVLLSFFNYMECVVATNMGACL